MKKVLLIIFLLLFTFVCCYVINNNILGQTKNAIININESTKFENKEIQKAISTVKHHFKAFYGCNMTDLWYNEEDAENAIEGYYNIFYTNYSDIIVLYSNFQTSKYCPEGLNRDFYYRKYMWILSRNNKSSKWRIVSAGY